MTEPTTPVAEDAHATAAQLLNRAAADYATGWGSANTRTDAEGSSS
jgi:hypothetical protein